MTQLDFGERPVPGSQPVPLDALLRSRLLVQANSGGGKSHLLRALLEATHGRVLQLVLDPEGEFATLALDALSRTTRDTDPSSRRMASA